MKQLTTELFRCQVETLRWTTTKNNLIFTPIV